MVALSSTNATKIENINFIHVENNFRELIVYCIDQIQRFGEKVSWLYWSLTPL